MSEKNLVKVLLMLAVVCAVGEIASVFKHDPPAADGDVFWGIQVEDACGADPTQWHQHRNATLWHRRAQ